MPVSESNSTLPAATGAKPIHRPAEGAVLLTDGRRGIGWPGTALQELHRSLALENPDAAKNLLYRTGFEWGLQEFLQLSLRVQTELGRKTGDDLWKLEAATAFQRWAEPLAAAGWGRWTFDRSAQADGVTLVELHGSAIARSAAASPTDPVCHLYAGLFAGALSFYDRTELHAVETQCAALGHPCCRFIVAPGPVIDRSEKARRGGANHEAIVRGALSPTKVATIPWKK